METKAFCADPPATVADAVLADPETFTPAIRIFLEKNAAANAAFEARTAERDAWLESHRLFPSADLCIDGRVQDFAQAVGLPVGILEMYRSKGSMIRLANPMYRHRCAEVLRNRKAGGGHAGGPRAEMRMVTAHWSVSRPDTASCAAWEHRTDAALADVQERCHEHAFAWRGRVVAFPVLIDTDLDAMTLFGPGGSYPVERLVRRLGPDEPPDPKAIVDALHQVFPIHWDPLARLHPEVRDAFHAELAERVVANVAFVRHVIASERPVELLTHGERLIFVGRHADWTEEHNTLFLIDDTEGEEAFTSFAIALKYVAKNVILDAIAEQDHQWRIPVVVNIPYAEEREHHEAFLHARQLGMRLRATVADLEEQTVRFLHGSHGIPDVDIPDWMFREMTDLRTRVDIVTCTSRGSTRLFVPFF